MEELTYNEIHEGNKTFIKVNFLNNNIDVTDLSIIERYCLRIVDKTITNKIKKEEWENLSYKINGTQIKTKEAFEKTKETLTIDGGEDLRKKIGNYFIKNMILQGTNSKLNDAFNENLPEMKRLKVINSRPFKYYDDFLVYMYELIKKNNSYYSKEYNLYKNIDFFEGISQKLKNENHFYNQLKEFYSKYQYLTFLRNPKTYHEYGEECTELLKYLYNAFKENWLNNDPEKKYTYNIDINNANLTAEQKECTEEEQNNIENDIDMDYILYKKNEKIKEIKNDLIGKVGELYFQKELITNKSINKKLKLSHLIHASKEIGDGLGYDIYGIREDNGHIVEVLTEIKTTLKTFDNENNIIYISKNEFNKYLTEQENPNIEYYVIRIHINEYAKNINNIVSHYSILKFDKNTNNLIDINNQNLIYFYNGTNNNGEYCYSRYKPENNLDLPKTKAKILYY